MNFAGYGSYAACDPDCLHSLPHFLASAVGFSYAIFLFTVDMWPQMVGASFYLKGEYHGKGTDVVADDV